MWRLELASFTNPLGKTHLEAGAGLEHLPLVVLEERLVWRLGLVPSIFLYTSLKTVHLEGGAGLKRFLLETLQENVI